MSRPSKFTDEQKMEIALDLVSGKLSHAEICRKWDIGSTYACKLKDRTLEILYSGIGKPDPKVSKLEKREAHATEALSSANATEAHLKRPVRNNLSFARDFLPNATLIVDKFQ